MRCSLAYALLLTKDLPDFAETAGANSWGYFILRQEHKGVHRHARYPVPMRRLLLNFQLYHGWSFHFIDQDCKTSVSVAATSRLMTDNPAQDSDQAALRGHRRL